MKDGLGHIPDRISGIAEIANNLWWSWHPEARMLFNMMNRALYILSLSRKLFLYSIVKMDTACRLLGSKS